MRVFALLMILLFHDTQSDTPSSSDPIVIAFDSKYVMIGYSGNDEPSYWIPAVVGKTGETYYFGDEANANRGTLTLTYPIQYGLITNMEYFGKLLEYAFKTKLGIDPQGRSVIITEAPLTPKTDREKVIQVK